MDGTQVQKDNFFKIKILLVEMYLQDHTEALIQGQRNVESKRKKNKYTMKLTKSKQVQLQ